MQVMDLRGEGIYDLARLVGLNGCRSSRSDIPSFRKEASYEPA